MNNPKLIKPICWLASFIFFALFSCQHDDAPLVEGSFHVLMDTVTEEVQYTTDQQIELGYYLSSSVDGKVTHLGLKIGTPGDYKVKLYAPNITEQIVLGEATIPAGQTDQSVFEAIEAIQIEANKKYTLVVSVPPQTTLMKLTLPEQDFVVDHLTIHYPAKYDPTINLVIVPFESIYYGVPDLVFTAE